MSLFNFYRYVPSSPGRLVEDITEIMKQEQYEDSTVDSTYETDNSNVQPQDSTLQSTSNTNHNPKRLSFEATAIAQVPKKAKKSLESSWDTTTDLPYIIETPVSSKSQ